PGSPRHGRPAPARPGRGPPPADSFTGGPSYRQHFSSGRRGRLPPRRPSLFPHPRHGPRPSLATCLQQPLPLAMIGGTSGGPEPLHGGASARPGGRDRPAATAPVAALPLHHNWRCRVGSLLVEASAGGPTWPAVVRKAVRGYPGPTPAPIGVWTEAWRGGL